MRVRLNETQAKIAGPKKTGAQQLTWDEEVVGLGILCSKTTKSFVVQRRNVRKRIGRWPELGVAAARRIARQELAKMEEDHLRPTNSLKLTLEQALDRYVSGMQHRKCSPQSIAQLKRNICCHVWDWRGKLLNEVTREMVVERHARIGKEVGTYAANAAFQALRSVWNDAMLVDDTLPLSPTIALKRRWFKERRRQEPVADLPTWARRCSSNSESSICVYHGL